MREIASCFDLSPQNMGLERDVNRGTSETAQDRDWDQAIKPFAGLIAAHLNRDLIYPTTDHVTDGLTLLSVKGFLPNGMDVVIANWPTI